MTAEAVKDGAEEIDMVINIGYLKGGMTQEAQDDIAAVVKAAHAGGAIVKVIIETCLLTEEEKVLACELSKAAGADFVKTSTGFSTAGATTQDIALMRKTVGPELGVKAAGGVRTRETAEAMIAAGATRIGASSSRAILEGCRGRQNLQSGESEPVSEVKMRDLTRVKSLFSTFWSNINKLSIFYLQYAARLSPPYLWYTMYVK